MGANKQNRKEIQKRWDSIGDIAAQCDPIDITGPNAHYNWRRYILKSDLPFPSRGLAHTLTMHGRSDGTNIYPSTAVLAAETGLSERAVCDHLDQLVLHGYLWRALKNTGRDWASTIYTLCVPKAVLQSGTSRSAPWEEDPSWRPEPGIRGTEPASVPHNP